MKKEDKYIKIFGVISGLFLLATIISAIIQGNYTMMLLLFAMLTGTIALGFFMK
jgi:hypothetical protein